MVQIKLAFFSSLFLMSLTNLTMADPVTLTGNEFVGVTPSGYVAYDSTSPTSNFSGPVATSNSVAYNVSLTYDTNTVYILVQAQPGLGSDGTSGQLGNNAFANLYLSTDPSQGTNVGIEVSKTGITDAFVPGGQGGYQIPAGDSAVLYKSSANGDSFEIGINWSFFTNDPAGLGFTKLAPGDTFQVRDSQSFGYTFVGGPHFGVDGNQRLAAVIYPGSAVVPEPSSIVMVTIAGLAGLAYSKRRKRIA